MIRWILPSCILVFVLVGAGGHYGHQDTWFNRSAPDTDKLRILQGRVKHADDVQRFFSNHHWLLTQEKTQVRARAVTWQHKHMRAWALRQIKTVRRQMWHTLPVPMDWVVAVRVAQRVYPGTADWLLSCSAAEGSHGKWVRYGGEAYYAGYEQTDAVGGWLQFRPSTYYAYVDDAVRTAKRRGFRVDPSVRSWLSPLGQALTGAYMRFYGRDGHHWSASYGRGC